ncbi:hypothetical protein HDU93_001987 [Gonapodya sp. JEL0774]|nr:hypothetical protein HDU93_001987 [Gonapodya sp. JEL0774]
MARTGDGGRKLSVARETGTGSMTGTANSGIGARQTTITALLDKFKTTSATLTTSSLPATSAHLRPSTSTRLPTPSRTNVPVATTTQHPHKSPLPPSPPTALDSDLDPDLSLAIKQSILSFNQELERDMNRRVLSPSPPPPAHLYRPSSAPSNSHVRSISTSFNDDDDDDDFLPAPVSNNRRNKRSRQSSGSESGVWLGSGPASRPRSGTASKSEPRWTASESSRDLRSGWSHGEMDMETQTPVSHSTRTLHPRSVPKALLPSKLRTNHPDPLTVIDVDAVLSTQNPTPTPVPTVTKPTPSSLPSKKLAVTAIARPLTALASRPRISTTPSRPPPATPPHGNLNHQTSHLASALSRLNANANDQNIPYPISRSPPQTDLPSASYLISILPTPPRKRRRTVSGPESGSGARYRTRENARPEAASSGTDDSPPTPRMPSLACGRTFDSSSQNGRREDKGVVMTRRDIDMQALRGKPRTEQTPPTLHTTTHPPTRPAASPPLRACKPKHTPKVSPTPSNPLLPPSSPPSPTSPASEVSDESTSSESFFDRSIAKKSTSSTRSSSLVRTPGVGRSKGSKDREVEKRGQRAGVRAEITVGDELLIGLDGFQGDSLRLADDVGTVVNNDDVDWRWGWDNDLGVDIVDAAVAKGGNDHARGNVASPAGTKMSNVRTDPSVRPRLHLPPSPMRAPNALSTSNGIQRGSTPAQPLRDLDLERALFPDNDPVGEEVVDDIVSASPMAPRVSVHHALPTSDVALSQRDETVKVDAFAFRQQSRHDDDEFGYSDQDESWFDQTFDESEADGTMEWGGRVRNLDADRDMDGTHEEDPREPLSPLKGFVDLKKIQKEGGAVYERFRNYFEDTTKRTTTSRYARVKSSRGRWGSKRGPYPSKRASGAGTGAKRGASNASGLGSGFRAASSVRAMPDPFAEIDTFGVTKSKIGSGSTGQNGKKSVAVSGNKKKSTSLQTRIVGRTGGGSMYDADPGFDPDWVGAGFGEVGWGGEIGL